MGNWENVPYRERSVDESGVSLSSMTGRQRRAAFGPNLKTLIHTVSKTVGKLDHVTVMSVVSAMGRMYKPILVFPGK